MIIDRPDSSLIPALRRLWKQAFGDSDTFLDGFFQTGFSFDRCRCLHTDGVLAAALYWFDCTWGNKKVAYIYAVATDDAFRGKGLCRALMEDTHQHLQSLGYAGAVLVPVSRELVTMYAKFGYRSFCPIKKATIPAKDVMAAVSISPEEYQHLRQALLSKNAVLHGDTGLQFFVTYGGFYKTENAIFCGYWENDTFHFEEILGQLPAQQEDFSEGMYLSLNGDPSLPDYFAIPLN